MTSMVRPAVAATLVAAASMAGGVSCASSSRKEAIEQKLALLEKEHDALRALGALEHIERERATTVPTAPEQPAYAERRTEEDPPTGASRMGPFRSHLAELRASPVSANQIAAALLADLSEIAAEQRQTCRSPDEPSDPLVVSIAGGPSATHRLIADAMEAGLAKHPGFRISERNIKPLLARQLEEYREHWRYRDGTLQPLTEFEGIDAAGYVRIEESVALNTRQYTVRIICGRTRMNVAIAIASVPIRPPRATRPTLTLIELQQATLAAYCRRYPGDRTRCR